MAHTKKTEVIDTVHSHVHEGITFQVSYKSPDGGDIADDSNITFAIFTGVRVTHLTFVCAAGGDAELAFYRGASLTGNGTNLFAVNLEQDRSIVTPATSVTHTPTVSANGVVIHNSLLPGGIGPAQSAGGVARSESEWVLKRNTTYLLRVINRSGTAQPMSIVAQWYEIDYEV